MNSITEHIRARLLDGVGVLPDPSTAARAEQSVRRLFGKSFQFIVREAQHRIRMGEFRYVKPEASQAVLSRLGLAPSYLDRLRAKLDAYEATGNQEYLVDALNYVLLEFNQPCREETFYRSTDREF